MGQGKIGNMVIATGRATKDAELKYVGSKNSALCDFGLVVGEKEDGSAVFANCKAWWALGEYASRIRKGDNVCVIGKLESREYNGKTYTDLVAEWLNVASAEPTQKQELSPSGTPFPAGVTFEEALDSGDGELPF